MTRFQPGFIIPAPAAGGLTLAHRANATSTQEDITVPAGAAAGDFAVVFEYCRNNVNEVLPTGWTDFGSALITSTSLFKIYGKILSAGDPGSGVSGSTGTDVTEKIMHVFSGGVATIGNIVPAIGTRLELTNGNPASIAVNAGSETAPLIVFSAVAKGAASAATWTTESPALTAKITVTRLVSGYRIYNSGPANHTFDKGDEGAANALAGFSVSLS